MGLKRYFIHLQPKCNKKGHAGRVGLYLLERYLAADIRGSGIDFSLFCRARHRLKSMPLFERLIYEFCV